MDKVRSLAELAKFTNGEATSPELVREAIQSLATHTAVMNNTVCGLVENLGKRITALEDRDRQIGQVLRGFIEGGKS